MKDADLHLKQIIVLNDHWILIHTSSIGEYWVNVQCLMLHQPNVSMGWLFNTHLGLNLTWALGFHAMFIYALSKDKYSVTTWYTLASQTKLTIKWPPSSNLQFKWKWLLILTCASNESEYQMVFDLHLHLWIWIFGTHWVFTCLGNGNEHRVVAWFSYLFKVHMNIAQPLDVHHTLYCLVMNPSYQP